MFELAQQYDLYLQQFNVLPLPQPLPFVVGQIVTVIAVVIVLYLIRNGVMFFNGNAEVIAQLEITNYYLRSIKTDVDLSERHLNQINDNAKKIVNSNDDILSEVYEIKDAWN